MRESVLPLDRGGAPVQAAEDRRTREESLKRLWFLGDVHGRFAHIDRAISAADTKPSWIVFLGDIDLNHMPLEQALAPLRRSFPATRVAFIHGNHDADTYEHWNCLHTAGAAVALHGQVVDLDGIKVAGLGGTFLGRVWTPPNLPLLESKAAAINRGAFQFRGGQRPHSAYHGAIYPEDFEQLAVQRADILVTHEAPGCHPYGYEKLDELAQSLGVLRLFHGHTHDDLTEQYKLVEEALGFEAIAVNYRAIKNGLGELIIQGKHG